MREEVLRLLDPKPGEIIADGTIGAGAHAEAIRAALSGEGLLLGLDRDPTMAEIARRRLAPAHAGGARVEILVANYSEMASCLESVANAMADGILLDLGVATPQLDDPRRGFSYRADGPLDMRMTPGEGVSAAEWIAHAPEAELADVLWKYGEERFARRIARAIARSRRAGPIRRTAELAEIIARAVPRGPRRLHPARRAFQAIRIATNRELDALERFLERLPGMLRPGGRCLIISYHSLEDRRVKNAFRAGVREGHYEALTRRPLRPSPAEVGANPRSRSARLRAVRRTMRGIPA
jgi:16S rRNA (cytosine1402-N4)-methyltransferase